MYKFVIEEGNAFIGHTEERTVYDLNIDLNLNKMTILDLLPTKKITNPTKQVFLC